MDQNIQLRGPMNEYERYGDYTEQKTRSNAGTNAGSALRFFVIGLGVGAAVTLLLSPMSGNELRNAIREGFGHAFEGINRRTRSLRDRGSNLLGFNRPRKAVGSEGEGI
jgi:hypothetical protein